VLVFLLVSCGLDDDSNNFVIETLPIKEAIVPVEFDYGQRHNIMIRYELPSGCHSFYNLFYQYEGTSRIIAVNSIVNEDVACTDDIREFEYTFEVNVVQYEDYTFKFWKGTDADGGNIFEEIIVPVNE
jgi:7-cyano-7-deazaguanine synthase in queuosine biosynthesis